MTCPFCEIDPNKNRVIAEFKTCYVMLSNPRKVSGHLLIIPKRHVAKLSEMNDKERKEILDTTIIYQEKILKYYPGTEIKQNYMPFVPDNRLKVTHLHIHIAPRENNDKIYQKLKGEAKLFKKLTETEILEWIKKLR
jgi:ATP adenylyltransferase